MKTLPKRLMYGVGISLIVTSTAHAENYTFANWLPPTHVLSRGMMEGWANAVSEASNGEVNFEVFSGGSLLPAMGTMQGVENGVAQAGHIAAPYHPSELPLNNVAGELGHETPDPFVLSAAFLDYSMNDPAAYAEWRRNGVIPGATAATETYYYMCSDAIHNHDDLRGMKVRAPGGGWARFSEYAGLIPVNIPASEMYTSMERGAVDCVAGDLAIMTSGAGILELTETIVLLPLSPAYNLLHIAYNPEFWQSLTEDQRRLLLDESAEAMANTQIMYQDEAAAALEEARASGVQVIEPDASLTNTHREWLESGMDGFVELAQSQFGIEDPQARMAEFQKYIDKWVGLMEGVDRNDVEAVTAVRKEYLLDKIDVSTYGMD